MGHGPRCYAGWTATATRRAGDFGQTEVPKEPPNDEPARGGVLSSGVSADGHNYHFSAETALDRLSTATVVSNSAIASPVSTAIYSGLHRRPGAVRGNYGRRNHPSKDSRPAIPWAYYSDGVSILLRRRKTCA